MAIKSSQSPAKVKPTTTAGNMAVFTSVPGQIEDGGAPGGGSGAPTGASYVTLGTDGTLTNERVLTAGAGITLTDAGAGSTITVSSTSGLVLLEQHTASSSASLDFTTSISSTYDEYLVEFVNVTPATDAVDMRLLFSTDGGSTWDTSNNYYGFYNGYSLLGGFTNINNPGTSFKLAPSIDKDFDGVIGSLRISNPQQNSFRHSILFDLLTTFSDGNVGRTTGGGTWNVTTAINAFRIVMSSGNIASGTVRCYGFAK